MMAQRRTEENGGYVCGTVAVSQAFQCLIISFVFQNKLISTKSHLKFMHGDFAAIENSFEKKN